MRIALRDRERAVRSTYAGHPPEAGNSCRAIVAAGSLVAQWCCGLYSVQAVCKSTCWRRGDSIIADHNGSWLNMAETELSVLATQCLDRRMPKPLTLTQEVAAWERQRNTAKCRVDWRFTT